MRISPTCLLLICLFVTSTTTALPQSSSGPAADPHSYARPDEVSIASANLNLKVDFKRKTLSGSVTYELDIKNNSPTVHLDSKNLKILKVTTHPEGVALNFDIGTADPILGSDLSIHLVEAPQKTTDPQKPAHAITIHYETSPSSDALSWLNSQQTSSGKPFLYSLSAPIMARS